MKIAIVGASDSVDKIYNILITKYSDIDFLLKKEDKIENMLQIIKQIREEIDGIFLTGIGVYHALINSKDIEVDKPVVYTKRGSIGLIKSFWELQKNNFNIKNLKLGLDVIDREIVYDVIREFDIDITEIFYQEYESSKTEIEYLEEYLKKYKEEKINCVFTAFGYIYNVLKEKNIPVYRLQATNIEIENEFLTLLNRIEVMNNKKSRIGIEIIKFNSQKGQLNKNNLESKIELEKKLIEYSKEIEGSIQICAEKEYMIISSIESLTSDENLAKIINLQKKLEENGEEIYIGIGEGNTTFKAEKNSRIALKLSLSKKGKIFYSNGEKIKGPLMNKGELEYKNTPDDKIKNIAEEIGISSVYLEKIKGMIKKQKKDEFTSVEIAEILNITPRSVNRIIKKIIEKNYAESVQVENSITAGRPRRIIKFCLE